MTDTKCEVPEIDWDKPVEAFLGGKWCEVDGVMRAPDGKILVNPAGVTTVAYLMDIWGVSPKYIRNKPEPLELWVNVYQGGSVGGYHYTSKEEASLVAENVTKTRLRCVRMREVAEEAL